jgi:hypothetical protein
MLLVGAIALPLNALATLVVMEWFLPAYFDLLDAASRGEPAVFEMPVQSGDVTTASLLGQLASLVVLAVAVVFMVWLYQSMTVARGLGLPARLPPVWAFLGFIIPVVSFWFPYWCAAGLFPAGPRRRVALSWWLSFVGAQLLTTIAYFSVLASYSTALTLVAVAAVLTVVSALFGRSMITGASELHAELAQQVGPVPASLPGGPVRAPAAPAPVVDPWARAAERQDDPWSNP